MAHDEDEMTTEFLIQHQSLEAVLAFVVARDDLRGIPAPLAEREDEPNDRPTMRVVEAVVAKAA